MKIGTKQLVPLIMVGFGSVFLALGMTGLGFWDGINGPQAGFFPSIISVVMIAGSLVALKQSFTEEAKAKYYRDECTVILTALGIFVAAFIVGLIPACIFFVILWLKVFEKADWKSTIIVTLVVAAIVGGVFEIWLGIQFPRGVFDHIL